eukprot:3413307-Prymnesium_polylepis.1
MMCNDVQRYATVETSGTGGRFRTETEIRLRARHPPATTMSRGGGLHHAKGGPKCRHTEPTEREGFALA